MNVNAKMLPVETSPGLGGEGTKEKSKGGEFKYDLFYLL
jgi:hypothetical protein